MSAGPALHPAFDLRLIHERAYVVRRVDSQRVAALRAAEAVALALMDGTRDAGALDRLLEDALPGRGASLVSSVRTRLKPLLPSGTRADYPALAALASACDPDPADGLRPLPGPRVLHWAVTQVCPRRCVYCFAEPRLGGAADDASIAREDLARIWTEAVSLGAEIVLVAGAEPLLRRDLPEVLGDAIRAGLTVVLTTKHPVSAALAARFARAGVPHLSFSLDSLDADENRRLIGTARYAEQVRSSVRHLAGAGVAFSIQAVVTRLNPDSARHVAAFAAREGARVLQIVPFKAVRSPIADLTNADLLLEDDAWLDHLVVELRDRHPAVHIEKFVEPGAAGTGYHCDIGQTKLFFLPDGVVHRCYKLTEDATLRGADLREVSVAAAWHDPQFGRVISPARALYSGAACGECGRFNACHDDGRCLFEASMRHGRYHAPDRSCDGPVAMPLRLLPSRTHAVSPAQTSRRLAST